jgi:hypothetical protein
MPRKHLLKSLLTIRISGSILILLLLFAAPVEAGLINGPAEELFLTGYRGGCCTNDRIFAVQGNSVIVDVPKATTNGYPEGPLAVGGTIRTMGPYSQDPGGPYYGAQYALDGDDMGQRYPNPVTDYNSVNYWNDGTTDGSTYNYALATVDDHNSRVSVYRFDRNWANPQYLFSAGANPVQNPWNNTYEAYSGITFGYNPGQPDPFLWLAGSWHTDRPPYQDHDSYYVLICTLGGYCGTSFELFQEGGAVLHNAVGLAMDPVTHWLWIGDTDHPGNLYAYNFGKLGANKYMGYAHYDALSNVTLSGAEFRMGNEVAVESWESGVPEPGTWLLAAAGGLVLVLKRRLA